MIFNCTSKGCKNSVSDVLSSDAELKQWVRLRACRCGAYDQREPRSCTCGMNDSRMTIPTSYWPNVDWWAFGGVEEIILCPDCKREVRQEIIKQRGIDPTMNSERPDHGNVH